MRVEAGRWRIEVTAPGYRTKTSEHDLDIGEIYVSTFQLEKGDCVRYVLSGPSRFVCAKKRAARYLISFVHP